ADRRAHYVCVLAFVRRADDPQPLIAEGEWHGEIAAGPRGEGGFGYDPYFWVPGAGCTVAQLDPVEKNRRSHRGQAMQLLAARLAAQA
ncbi:MAG TPA: non-canonical purine NTP pyrophosphatase, partial [Rhodocyclaceae bacterium]